MEGADRHRGTAVVAMTPGGPLDGASPALAAALTVRFLLEVALLAGAAVVAWHAASGGWRWPLVVLAPVVVAVVWGTFLSPKAKMVLPEPARVGIEAALFLGAGAGLILVGFPVPAIAGVAVWTADRIAIAMLRR